MKVDKMAKTGESTVRMMFGIRPPSEFVLKSMAKTNLDTIGYECIFLTWFCALVALSTFAPIPPWDGRPAEVLTVYRVGLFGLAAVSLLFSLAINRTRKSTRLSFMPSLLMLLFMIVVMGFSMWLTLFDFATTRIFFVYVAALLLVFGLIYLPPIITIAIVLICTTIMIFALNAAGYANPAYGVTLMGFSFLVVIVSTSGYHTRLRITIANENSRDLSIHDDLTGAKNRRALDVDANRYVSRHLFLLLGDIDEFKFYNDRYGHTTGDQILRQFSDSMTGAFGKDYVYRYGGDEFVAIMPEVDERTFLDAVAAWRNGFRVAGEEYSQEGPTTSGGYAEGTPRSEDELFEMLRLADVRLYDAKQAGRNMVLGAPYDDRAKASLAADMELMGKRRKENADPLTGLPSIVYFHAQAKAIIESPESQGSRFNIVYFNVENMKAYNERFGIEAGDELLVFVARTIEQSFEHVLLSRFGDDRFVMLTSGGDLQEGLKRVHDQLLSYNDNARTIIRAGIYPYDEPIEMTIACDRAKLACDHIKGHYNVYYYEFDPTLLEARDTKQFIVDRFQQALDQGHIKVYYQPIIRSISGHASDYEALARWIDPENGFISPGDFIPALEELRLVHQLDLKVIELICADYADRVRRGFTMVPININLSRFDMELCDIVEETIAIMDRYSVPPNMLNIEITESAFAKDNALLRDTIDRFHERGMQVWMDDFGNGYSSLNALREFDFDVVKIDMGFLRHSDDTSRARSREMLPHIVSMLKDLGLQTLIEGVETPEQHQFLKGIGCEKLQGFAFARPMCTEDVFGAMEKGEVTLETPVERTHLDVVGGVNLLKPASIDEDLGHDMELSSGLPAAIVEFCGGAVHYLAWNSSYLDYLRDIGMETIENSTRQMNDMSRPQSKGFHGAAAQMKGKPEWLNLTFYEGEDLCTGMARCISVNEESDATAFLYIAFNVGSFMSNAGYNIPRHAEGA